MLILMNGQTWAREPQRLALSRMPHPAQRISPCLWILWSMPPQRALKVNLSWSMDAICAKQTIQPALREAVANLYNDNYRKGKASQYTFENVCIVPGGRAGLSRVAAVIGDVYCVCVVSLVSLSSHSTPRI